MAGFLKFLHGIQNNDIIYNQWNLKFNEIQSKFYSTCQREKKIIPTQLHLSLKQKPSWEEKQVFLTYLLFRFNSHRSDINRVFIFTRYVCMYIGFPGGSDGKESACNAGDPGLIPGLGRGPGAGGMATHSSILEIYHLLN